MRRAAKPVRAYIALGSNLGNRLGNIRLALAEIRGLAGPGRMARSSLFETEPVGVKGHPDYLNMVASVETALPPGRLMRGLLSIERKLGRSARSRKGPRPIDLDILYYGDMVVKRPGLTIPHPRLHQRAFVLNPLAELAPDLVDPARKSTVREMLRGLERGGQRVEKIGRRRGE